MAWRDLRQGELCGPDNPRFIVTSLSPADPGLARSLGWYAAVAANRNPAKFRIAATIPASLPVAEAAEPALWKELEQLTPVFLSCWGGLRDEVASLRPAAENSSLLDLCCELGDLRRP
jgi:putative pyruvate formate lyase activating enzyme